MERYEQPDYSRERHSTSRYGVYDIMKSYDLAVNSPAKSRKHKWIRFECLHSNAMWHTDWHDEEFTYKA